MPTDPTPPTGPTIEGVEFYDKIRGPMLLKRWGDEKKPWLFCKGAEGQWVSMREATEQDLQDLSKKGIIFYAWHGARNDAG